MTYISMICHSVTLGQWELEHDFPLIFGQLVVTAIALCAR